MSDTNSAPMAQRKNTSEEAVGVTSAHPFSVAKSKGQKTGIVEKGEAAPGLYHDSLSATAEDQEDSEDTMSSKSNYAQEEDFFAERYEEGELPEHLKDAFLEQIEKSMDEKVTAEDLEGSQHHVLGTSKRQAVEEDPHLVSKGLDDLDVEIERLKRVDKKRTELYCRAEEQSNEFVTDRSFRLMFLRSESFNIKSAAQKIMTFFEVKETLWGREKLTKKINLDDLDAHDMAALQSGAWQLLQAKDHAGRSILFNNLNYLQYQDGINLIRAVWYLVMTALEEEDIQKKGFVVVQYKVGERKGIRAQRRSLFLGATVARGIPAYLGAFHVCFGRRSLPFVRILKFCVDNLSCRVRVHEGSQAECLQTLETFGIPKCAIPITADGELTTGSHQNWIESRKLISA